jgi:hypothetical protein
MNERLDEIIDRVAAELTAVPPDPQFTTRVRDRLVPGRQRRPVWFTASAAAAAVIVLTLIARFVAMPPGDAAIDDVLHSRTVGVGWATLPPAARSEQGEASVPDVVDGPVVVVQELGVDRSEPAAVSADDLKVDPLVVEAIEVPAVAVIVPLDVPHLEIGEIAAGELAKEPK